VLKVIAKTGDAWLDGERLYLPKRLSDTLVMLAEGKGKTVSNEKLHRQFGWDEEVVDDRHALQCIVYRLRRFLGPDSIKIRVRVGYALTMPVEFIEEVIDGGDRNET